MDKFKLHPKLKIPPVSSRTMSIFQKVPNLHKMVAKPLTVQNSQDPDNFVEMCDNSLILHIPEVTDGIFSSGKQTTENESTQATDGNIILNNDDHNEVDDQSIRLDNCGLELFSVINNGKFVFSKIIFL